MAENNLILAEDLARVRSIDFTYQFAGELSKFAEVLGTTRKIAVQEGTTLKALQVTGTLESGVVGEGELIPLSHYETIEVPIGTAVLHKRRKGTSAEAIMRSGREQAVNMTTERMKKDILKEIRDDFFKALATGTGTATGVGLQAALADGWGNLQILFEDDAVEPVYFLNPLDISGYLGRAQVSMQSTFGMNYLENFLGLGNVLTNSKVPKGTFYATPKDNIIMYYISMNGDIASTFKLISDETGYIGIREYLDEDHANVMNLIMSGASFFPERVDGIIKGTIEAQE